MTVESQTAQNNSAGILFIILAVLAISINDMLVKFLSGDYPLHEIVFTRSVIGLAFGLAFVQFEGGWKILKTRHPGLHLLRGVLIVIANMTFFTALAVLPLAEATAVFFLAPLMITLISIPILGEKVGPLRLAAVVVGLVGVLIVTRPWDGGASREVPLFIYLLPVFAALTYATNQVLTRKLGGESKASAMAIYIQSTFIVVSLGFWIFAGDGRYAEGLQNESMIFLLRAWTMPEGLDVWLFIALGLNAAVLGYSIAQAYRLAAAATIAPFEYIGLPLAIFWGWLIWEELPSLVQMLGIFLILGSGLFVFLRERQKERFVASQAKLRQR